MKKAINFLKKDKKFALLIKKFGLPNSIGSRENHFQSLVRAIIYQQISGKAAASIMKKFEGLFKGGKFPTPMKVKKLSPTKLRSAGISPQKTKYLKDLAEKFVNGTINSDNFPQMSNEEISEHLIQVKGIGQWTADMFLIFTLGRLNILPVGDLGIQKGFKHHFNLRNLPSESKMRKLAKPYQEYSSIISWYMWKVADEKNKTPDWK
ncbi:MAG: DNA-3-methyladenine glycosylase [Patescibacteria group bacterium]